MGWTYFLACIISVSSFVAGQNPKYVLKGTWFNLKPDIPAQPSSILWKHNGNKVVEFDGSEQQIIGLYKNRITLDWITAELEITGLRIEDSGNYELEAIINNSPHTDKYQLEVIDTVAKPKISCKIKKGSSPDESEGQATLMCSAAQPKSLVKFEWRSQGSSYPGDKITLSLKDLKDEEEYTCVVSNPLSSETATLTVKDCNHEEESSSGTIVALSILALIGVVGTALGLLFCKFKQKACFANDEEIQEPTTEAEKIKPLLSEGKDENDTALSSEPLKPSNSNEDNCDSDVTIQDSGVIVPEPVDVKARRKLFEQLTTANESNRGPAKSPPPVLDPQSKSFHYTKNDEGGQDDVPNKSLQEKAKSEETSAPATDETSHSTEAPPDIPAHTENEDNKEPEFTEETAGTTAESDIRSSETGSSSVPE